MKILFLSILLVIMGCSSSLKTATYPNFRELTLHADVDFTPEERRIIHDATHALMSQGFVGVHVIYDLDFSKAESLSSRPQLIRMRSDGLFVRDLETRHRYYLYGFTNYSPWLAVYLVYDRLYGEDFARHVVMHELLHAFGCDHVQDPSAVLYLLSDGRHMATRLTATDMAELDRASRSSLASRDTNVPTK